MLTEAAPCSPCAAQAADTSPSRRPAAAPTPQNVAILNAAMSVLAAALAMPSAVLTRPVAAMSAGVRVASLPTAVSADRFGGLWRYRLLPAGCLAVALGVGGISVLRPRLALVICLGLGAIVWVSARPEFGGYLVIGLTPLIAGIDRGHVLPVLRPSEALALAVGIALSARAVIRWRTGALARVRPSRIELAIVLMAVSNSVVPLLWMAARQQPVTQDDILYALVMWKYLGVYLIVRASITTNRQAMRCLWLSVAAASIIAKVTRDRLMARIGLAYPGYGFERHMGYGVPEHVAALERLGPTPGQGPRHEERTP